MSVRRFDLTLLCSALALVLGASCRPYMQPPPGNGAPATGGAPGTGGEMASGGSTGEGSGGSTAEVNPPADTRDADPPADTALTCGGAGLACCPGNRCILGGCCENGTCTPYGDQCTLAPGQSCFMSACSRECGGLGMKCCAQQNCTYPLSVCDGVGSGTCVACGNMGQPCCRNSHCEGTLACNMGKCTGMTVGGDK